MKRTDYEVASRAAQGLMSGFDASLGIDGKWGRKTQSVFDKLPRERQTLVETVLRSLGTSPSELMAFRNAERENAAKNAAGYDGSVDAAIRQAAAESGVSEPLLRGFAKIESNFNPLAANGSSRGLLQMQPAAWSDAKSVNPKLRDYVDAVFDPLENARAGAAYIKWTLRQLSRIKGFVGDVTPAMMYLAHQQGVGGFTDLWRAANGLKQEKSYVTDRAMLGNPPQDGKGPTKDKAEFYRRWIKVAEAKFRAAGV